MVSKGIGIALIVVAGVLAGCGGGLSEREVIEISKAREQETLIVEGICTTEYTVLSLGAATKVLHDHLAGGPSTLEDVTRLLEWGLGRDYYFEGSTVCGRTDDGKAYLKPIGE